MKCSLYNVNKNIGEHVLGIFLKSGVKGTCTAHVR